MPELATDDDGNTPLSEDELADLIPSLAVKAELNEWERENILHAREWAIRDRTIAVEIASDDYVRKLHSRMFSDTWKWAGTYRKTEKNIGVQVYLSVRGSARCLPMFSFGSRMQPFPLMRSQYVFITA